MLLQVFVSSTRAKESSKCCSQRDDASCFPLRVISRAWPLARASTGLHLAPPPRTTICGRGWVLVVQRPSSRLMGVPVQLNYHRHTVCSPYVYYFVCRGGTYSCCQAALPHRCGRVSAARSKSFLLCFSAVIVCCRQAAHSLRVPRALALPEVFHCGFHVAFHRDRRVARGSLRGHERGVRLNHRVRVDSVEPYDGVPRVGSLQHSMRRSFEHAIREPLQNVANDDHEFTRPHRSIYPPLVGG